MKNFDRLKAFAEKVDKKSHDECWEWKARKNVKGYGQFKTDQGSMRAHRYVWELFFGKIPKDQMVLHKCNNPSCVNPYHLYLGDAFDNAEDALRAGTHPGFQGRKLNNSDVSQVIELLCLGKPQRKIAKTFGVSLSTINSIGKGIPSYVR